MKKILILIFFLCVILLQVLPWSGETGYMQIEQYNNVEIYKQSGERAEFKSIIDVPAIIFKPGENYVFKIKLINNAEKIPIFHGKIRLVISYGMNPNNQVIVGEYDNVIFKNKEIKEFCTIVSYEKLSILQDKNKKFKLKAYCYSTDLISNDYKYLYNEWYECSRYRGSTQFSDVYIFFQEGYDELIKRNTPDDSKKINLLFNRSNSVENKSFPRNITINPIWKDDYMTGNITIGGSSAYGKGCVIVNMANIIDSVT